MAKKWRLTDRTRTFLTLELAIVLPAVALMAFSMFNLKQIQRDKAIEAAIQREFSYVLRIAEHKSWERASGMVAEASKSFPSVESGRSEMKKKLSAMLLDHPEFAYAILYDKNEDLFVSELQPNHEDDAK